MKSLDKILKVFSKAQQELETFVKESEGMETKLLTQIETLEHDVSMVGDGRKKAIRVLANIKNILEVK